jgi:hypothetical protein
VAVFEFLSAQMQFGLWRIKIQKIERALDRKRHILPSVRGLQKRAVPKQDAAIQF